MRIEKKIFALGFFDGVHLGHQALLQECVSMARQYGYEPAAITFDRHPQSLFTSTPPGLINSNADRDALLCRFGMESIHRLEVSVEVMSTNWRIFLENLLERAQSASSAAMISDSATRAREMRKNWRRSVGNGICPA